MGLRSVMVIGWDGRIRTYGWRYQKPLPYHLATSHFFVVVFWAISGVFAMAFVGYVCWIRALLNPWQKPPTSHKILRSMLKANNYLLENERGFLGVGLLQVNEFVYWQGLEPILKPNAPRFSTNFGSFFCKIFGCIFDTAAKFCKKIAQNFWKSEARWILRQALVIF